MLEQNVMRLEKENSKMETLVNKIRDDFNEQQRMQAKLKEEDSNLTAKLRENEIERNKLDQQIGTLSTQKETFAGKLELQNKKIAELENELLDIDKKARQIRKIEQARDDLALELKLAQEKVKDQEQIIARLEAAQRE